MKCGWRLHHGIGTSLGLLMLAFFAAAGLTAGSEPLAISQTQMTRDRFEIQYPAHADEIYQLQISKDLRTWHFLNRHFSTRPDTLTFADLQTDAPANRFYRVAEVTDSGEERPNILFIMTDDQAPWALGEAGHPHAITPNMDRLFEEGATLSHMFTPTPVCSPSRATLLTSQYGSELGITDWIHPGREPELGLDPATVVWPEMLSEAGYANGLVGKWHLGIPERFHPTRMGYSYFMGFRSGGNSPKDPTLEKEGETQQFSGFTPDILTDHALRFIRDHESEPWTLSLHYRAPHAPWLPVHAEDWGLFMRLDPTLPDPDYPKLDIDRVKQMTREYLASVKSVDVNVGRLLDLLEELELAENTVVVFTSDHGYNMGHNGIWHKGNGHWVLTDPPPATPNIPRGQRPNMYDHSIRVPAAVRWPEKIEPGSVVDETLTFLDWYPTILSIAGVSVPDNQKIRGRNFLPLLLGETLEWNNGMFGQYSTHHQSTTHMRMWRTQEWKLVRDFLNSDRDELYHLTVDPAESTNLIDSPDPTVQETVQTLHRKIVNRMREINDPALEDMERLYGPPRVESVEGHISLEKAIVHFSKPVTPESAEDPAHYEIDPLSIRSVSLREDRRSVELETPKQEPGQTYEVRVVGVKDDNERIMDEAASVQFTAWQLTEGVLRMEVYRGIGGNSVDNLTLDPKFPDSPDEVSVVNQFEASTNVGDHYGVRLTGWITPPETGDYVFYVCSDDDSVLLLSSDDDRADLEQIARDPLWHRPRDWVNPERRKSVGDSQRLENESRPIHLEAGNRYAVEARMKDGSGGDNLAVTWRRVDEPAPAKGDAPIGSEVLSTIAAP